MTPLPERIWAYHISFEKNVLTEEYADKLSSQIFGQLSEESFDSFSRSQGCADTLRTYWKSFTPRDEYVFHLQKSPENVILSYPIQS